MCCASSSSGAHGDRVTYWLFSASSVSFSSLLSLFDCSHTLLLYQSGSLFSLNLSHPRWLKIPPSSFGHGRNPCFVTTILYSLFKSMAMETFGLGIFELRLTTAVVIPWWQLQLGATSSSHGREILHLRFCLGLAKNHELCHHHKLRITSPTPPLVAAGLFSYFSILFSIFYLFLFWFGFLLIWVLINLGISFF